MSESQIAMSLNFGENDELLEHEPRVRPVRIRFRSVTLVACIFAVCACISLWHYPISLTKVRSSFLIGFDADVEVDTSEDDCAHVPYVMLTSVVSSNLGKQGPDTDAEEGIIYKATPHNTGADIPNLEIHVHSLTRFDETDAEEKTNYDTNYRPAFNTGEFVNGLHGRFGIITVTPGESVKVRAHAYDADTQQDIALPHGAISFFDLDTGADSEHHHSHEHVTIGGFKTYYLTNETEVDVSRESIDDFTVFSATKTGTGDDNPTDPLELTPLQKNRAVTVEFEDHHEFNFEIGASEGTTGRVFSFCFRPSLLCAATKMVDGSLIPPGGKGAPVIPVRGEPDNAGGGGGGSGHLLLIALLGVSVLAVGACIFAAMKNNSTKDDNGSEAESNASGSEA